MTVERPGFRLAVAAELEGPVTGVLGPSGAGKTTLLQAIAGLAPARGRITLAGEDLLATDADVCLPPERRRIGYVFQDGRLFPHLDVRRNLEFARRGRAVDGGPDPARVVATLELDGLLARQPATLSGGERQRVALGRALLSGPRLLLLDEPLSGVDPPRRRRILTLVMRVRDAFGIPILYVTHDVAEVLTLTDRLLLLEAGASRGAGPLAELAADPDAVRLVAGLGLDNALPVEVLALEADGARGRSGQAELVLPTPPAAAAAGQRWAVHLRPEDVILAPLHPEPPPLSARNRLTGKVSRLVEVDGRVFVEVVAAAAAPLRAEVSPGAVESLGLRAGAAVWCLFKATALRWGSQSPAPTDG